VRKGSFVAYIIDFESDAVEDLKALRKGERVRVLTAIEEHLTYEPTRQSKSRIKHLRPGSQPPYRLRIDTLRVYYDVRTDSKSVTIYGIVDKERSLEWLAAFAQKLAGKDEQP